VKLKQILERVLKIKEDYVGTYEAYKAVKAEVQIETRPAEIAGKINARLGDHPYKATPTRLVALQQIVSETGSALTDEHISKTLAHFSLFFEVNNTDTKFYVSLEDFLENAAAVFQTCTDDSQLKNSVAQYLLEKGEIYEHEVSEIKGLELDFKEKYRQALEEAKKFARSEWIMDENIVARMLNDRVHEDKKLRHRLLDRNRERLVAGGDLIALQEQYAGDTREEALIPGIQMLLSACIEDYTMKLRILESVADRFIQEASPEQSEMQTKCVDHERRRMRLKIQFYNFLAKIVEEEKDYVTGMVAKVI
jgi:hypothetical protein